MRRLLRDFVKDLGLAARQFSRSPGFVLAATLTLAIGIGATTTISSVVNTVVLQPLPYPDADRLVRVLENIPSRAPGRAVVRGGVTYAEFLEWSGRTTTLSESFGVVGMAQRLVRTHEGAAGLWGAAMTANALTALGVTPIVGRTFSATDGNLDVALLSFHTWRQHFNSDPEIAGRTLELRTGALQAAGPSRLLTIVGVLPESFEFPTGPADFYTPLSPSAGAARITVIGRLVDGISIDAARAELNGLGATAFPPGAAVLPMPRFDVQPLKDLALGNAKPALGVFLGAVIVVLLIVCANVSNLVLARGMSRQRDIAVRFALGATRGRIIRQIMAECAVLAAAGGALGAVVGAAGVMAVRQLAAVDAPGIFRLMFGSTVLPRAHEIRVDLTVFAIALLTAAVTTFIFGVLPALHLSRQQDRGPMGQAGRAVLPAASRTRAALVVGQLAMATVLLVAAGLFIQSFIRLSGNPRGYEPSGVLALQLLLPNEYSPARKVEVIDSILSRLRRLPGVTAAGFSRHGVLIGEELTIGTFVPPGRTLHEMRSDPDRPRVRSVSHGFLTAMDVPLIEGREFEIEDAVKAAPVIVINRSAARRFFGIQSAVGQHVSWHIAESPVRVTVVGVVEDVRQESLAQETFPEVYVEYHQFMRLLNHWPDHARRQNEWALGFLSVAIRTSGVDQSSSIPRIRQLINSSDSNAGIDALVPLTDLLDGSTARERFVAVMLGAFAATAALLAAIGIYGVLAYLVVQRKREIGLRMALGAQRTQVLALVLRHGVGLSTIGIALGLLGASAGTRLLEGMLFDLHALDVRTFAGVAALFSLVAAFASCLPAWRATRVDPMEALRAE